MEDRSVTKNSADTRQKHRRQRVLGFCSILVIQNLDFFVSGLDLSCDVVCILASNYATESG